MVGYDKEKSLQIFATKILGTIFGGKAKVGTTERGFLQWQGKCRKCDVIEWGKGVNFCENMCEFWRWEKIRKKEIAIFFSLHSVSSHTSYIYVYIDTVQGHYGDQLSFVYASNLNPLYLLFWIL